MKRLLTISIWVLLVLTPLSSSWGVEYIPIGHLTSVSGPGAMWGEARVGFEQAIEDINSKGGVTVKGKEYHFKGVVYDSKFQPDLAVAGTNKLIFNDKTFWLQCMGTAPCIATVPIATENKAIQFHGGYVKDLLGPYSFKTMGSKEFYLALLPYLKKNHAGAKKIAIIAMDNDTGRGSVANIKSVLKLFPDLEFIHDEYYTPGTIDFSSIVLKVLQKKPDVLDLACDPAEETGAIIKAARQLGFKGATLGDCAMDPIRISDVAGKENAEGYFYPSTLDPLSPGAPPEYKAVFNKIVAKHGEKKAISLFNIGVPLWYLGVEMLAQAIKGTQSFNTDDLVKYLESHEFTTIVGKAVVQGELTYGLKRQILYPLTVGVLKNGKPVISETMPLPEKY